MCSRAISLALFAATCVVGCDAGLHSLGDPPTDTDDTGVPDTGPPDDTGAPDDTSIDPTAEVTGLVEFTLLQVACPGCFNTTTDLVVSATAAFHGPTTGSWIGWMPPLGSCAMNPTAVPLANPTEDRGQWVYLESGSKSISLLRTPGDLGTIYAADGLGDPDYLRNASWDVVLPEAGGTRISGGLHTTEGFDDIQPWEMLYVYPEAAFAAAVSQSGQTFTWAPAGSADRFVILVDAYDGYTGAYLASAACTGPDSGSMQVPPSVLSAFPTYSLLGVGLYRYQVNRASVPIDGTTLESVSWVGVLGTATLTP